MHAYLQSLLKIYLKHFFNKFKFVTFLFKSVCFANGIQTSFILVAKQKFIFASFLENVFLSFLTYYSYKFLVLLHVFLLQYIVFYFHFKILRENCNVTVMSILYFVSFSNCYHSLILSPNISLL